MDLSRRSFLGVGSRIGLGALFTGNLVSLAFGQSSSPKLGTGIGAVIPKEALNTTLAHITEEMFIQNVGTRFMLSRNGVQLFALTLIEVNDMNPGYVKTKPTNGKECYELVFQGPRNYALTQNTYTMTHSTLGVFDLFIVPGDLTQRTGIRYGADINRINP